MAPHVSVDPAELPILSFGVDVDSSTSHIRLSGELDEDTAALLGCVIGSQVASGRTDVCLDLAGLTFFDLRGFRAVCAARDVVREHGGRLRVINASPLFHTVATWWEAIDIIDDSSEPDAAVPAARSLDGGSHAHGGLP